MRDPAKDTRARPAGFTYHLTPDQLETYQQKPLELRLAWLYQGNVLRMHYPPEIIARQERFRSPGR